MSLNENTNYLGKIILNGSPSNTIDIVLYFSDKGVFFEFYGNFIPETTYGILTGILFGNEEFTLINSFKRSYKNELYKYESDYLIWGVKHQTKESLVFNRYRFIVQDLNNWIGKEFWKFHNTELIRIKDKDTLFNKVINIEDGVNLKISNGLECNNNFRNYTLELIGYSFIEIISINKDKGFSLDFIFSFLSNFLKLLSLVSIHRYSINKIYCILDHPHVLDKKKISDSYPVYRKVNEEKKYYSFCEIYFRFEEVEEYLEILITEWHKREELRHLIDLNLTFCLNTESSRNTHFLNAFACIEGIDKHLNGMDDTAWTRLNRYESFIKEIYPESIVTFIKNCLDTRNFYAHGKKKKDEYIFNNFELLYAAKTLINISRVLLLKELGIPEYLLYNKFKAIATCIKEYMSSNKWRNEGLIEIPKL